MAKVQGEGDYESARRYEEDTKKFVQDNAQRATQGPGGPIDAQAERKALSKARDGGQVERDRDAKAMAADSRQTKGPPGGGAK